jgi:amino acid transporter
VKPRLRPVVVAIASVLLPGLGHAATGRRRAALLFLAPTVLAVAGVITGVFLFSPHASEAAASLVRGGEAASALTASGFGFAMLSAMWAYSGWQYLPMTAAEVRDPDRNVPRAVIGGGLLVVVLYLLVNAAYFQALPFEAVLTSNSTAFPEAPAVGARAAETFLGPQAISLACSPHARWMYIACEEVGGNMALTVDWSGSL